MRISTLIRWLIVLVVLGWAGYTVAGAGWTYLAIGEMVDKTLREASARNRNAFVTGTVTDSVIRDVRSSIVLAARHDGLPVEDGNVQVAATSAGIAATVSWSYPVITFGGSDILIVPMSVQRSFVPTP
jgi:hypothetical protein